MDAGTTTTTQHAPATAQAAPRPRPGGRRRKDRDGAPPPPKPSLGDTRNLSRHPEAAQRAISAWQDDPAIATPEDHAALANLERQAGVSLSPQLPRARCAVMFARLVAGGYWRAALAASGLSWQHVGIMQAGDPEGFGRLAEAAEAAKDAIFRRDGRDALRARAIDGVEEPVYQRGELVGHRKRHSDRLLEFGLSKLDKPTFGDDRRAVAQTAGVIYNIGVAIGDDAAPKPARPEKVIDSGTSAAQRRAIVIPQDV